MNFTTIYTHNRERSKAFSTTNDGPSLTQQSDLQDTDINVIMARYVKTGQVPQLADPGIGGDFTEVNDYRTALDKIRELDAQFMSIPAEIRKKFQNDPAQFLEFAQNPDNADEMVKMGLAERREPPQEYEYTASRRAYDDNRGIDDDPDETPSPRQEKTNGNTTAGERAPQNRPAGTAGGQPRGR